MASWKISAVLFNYEGKAVGYALFYNGEVHVYLSQFYVKAEYRRNGMGRIDLAGLRENAWNSERPVRVEVLVHNDIGV